MTTKNRYVAPFLWVMEPGSDVIMYRDTKFTICEKNGHLDPIINIREIVNFRMDDTAELSDMCRFMYKCKFPFVIVADKESRLYIGHYPNIVPHSNELENKMKLFVSRLAEIYEIEEIHLSAKNKYIAIANNSEYTVVKFYDKYVYCTHFGKKMFEVSI
jgi:hypothetical protein